MSFPCSTPPTSTGHTWSGTTWAAHRRGAQLPGIRAGSGHRAFALDGPPNAMPGELAVLMTPSDDRMFADY